MVRLISGLGVDGATIGAPFLPASCCLSAANAVPPSEAMTGSWWRMCLVGSAIFVLPLACGRVVELLGAGKGVTTQLGEQTIAGGGDLVGEETAARFGALEVPLENLAALGMLLGLEEQQLAHRFVGEDLDQPLGVEHGEGEVLARVPLLGEGARPVGQLL